VVEGRVDHDHVDVENICRGPERGGPSEVRGVKALECERKGTHAFKGAHVDDEEETAGETGIRGRAVYAEESRGAHRATQLRV